MKMHRNENLGRASGVLFDKMKIQNGRQEAIFNRICPNFELNLHFMPMNIVVKFGKVKIWAGPPAYYLTK